MKCKPVRLMVCLEAGEQLWLKRPLGESHQILRDLYLHILLLQTVKGVEVKNVALP